MYLLALKFYRFFIWYFIVILYLLELNVIIVNYRWNFEFLWELKSFSLILATHTWTLACCVACVSPTWLTCVVWFYMNPYSWDVAVVLVAVVLGDCCSQASNFGYFHISTCVVTGTAYALPVTTQVVNQLCTCVSNCSITVFHDRSCPFDRVLIASHIFTSPVHHDVSEPRDVIHIILETALIEVV